MKGKVVLIQFPFDDLSDHKVRPAYCLTDSIDDYTHIILSLQSAHASNRAS
jgi:mRNA interferase MazF